MWNPDTTSLMIKRKMRLCPSIGLYQDICRFKCGFAIFLSFAVFQARCSINLILSIKSRLPTVYICFCLLWLMVPATNSWTTPSISIELTPRVVSKSLSVMIFLILVAVSFSPALANRMPASLYLSPDIGSSSVKCLKARFPLLTSLCILQAPRNAPHITELGSSGIDMMSSSASASRPARPRRSTMHP